MTPLRESTWFTVTSSDPYDRHHYRVEIPTVGHRIVDNYAEATRLWIDARSGQPIQVIDPLPPAKEKKRRGSHQGKPEKKGFS